MTEARRTRTRIRAARCHSIEELSPQAAGAVHPLRAAAFYFTFASAVDYLRDDHRETLGPGEGILVHRGSRIRFLPPEQTGNGAVPPKLLRLELDLDPSDESRGSSSKALRVDSPALPWLVDVLRYCATVPVKRRIHARRTVDALLELLWEGLARGGSSPKDARPSWLATTLDRMRVRPSETWTVDSLAREAGVSRSSFAEHFAREMGQSPMRFLLEQRMKLALRLLRDGRALKEIAPSAGYSSEAAFSTAFKRWSGHSPGAYRHTR